MPRKAACCLGVRTSRDRQNKDQAFNPSGLLIDRVAAAGGRLFGSSSAQAGGFPRPVRGRRPPAREPWGGYMAVFADPDGNTYYLDQIDPQHG